MRFRWNNEWQKTLDAFDRQKAAAHERGHLAFSKLSSRELRVTREEIATFERGEPCQEPLADGMCLLDVSSPEPDNRWNVAPFDIPVNDAFKEKP